MSAYLDPHKETSYAISWAAGVVQRHMEKYGSSTKILIEILGMNAYGLAMVMARRPYAWYYIREWTKRIEIQYARMPEKLNYSTVVKWIEPCLKNLERKNGVNRFTEYCQRRILAYTEEADKKGAAPPEAKPRNSGAVLSFPSPEVQDATKQGIQRQLETAPGEGAEIRQRTTTDYGGYLW